MGRSPPPKKCRDCAVNLLTKEDALRVHGPGGSAGDNCWAGKPCQDKRARLKDPLHNAKRKQKRKVAQGITTYKLKPSGAYAPILHLYRATTTAPVHAIGAELFCSVLRRGDKILADIEVFHTCGLTESGIDAKLAETLDLFSKKARKKLLKFRDFIDINPSQCPCRPCPLHPTPGRADVTFTV